MYIRTLSHIRMYIILDYNFNSSISLISSSSNHLDSRARALSLISGSTSTHTFFSTYKSTAKSSVRPTIGIASGTASNGLIMYPKAPTINALSAFYTFSLCSV